MSRRLSLYVGPPLRALLDERGGESEAHGSPAGGGVSGIVNTVADRYRECLRRSVPVLTEAEWMAVADALNGVWLAGDASHLAVVWAEIEDTDRLNGLGAKWGIDALALARRLRELPYAGLLAVVDVVERLWQDPGADWAVRLRDLLAHTPARLPPPAGAAALGRVDLGDGETAPLTDDQAEALVSAIRAGDRASHDELCRAWGIRNAADVWRATRRRLRLDPGPEAPCPHCGQPASEMAPLGCPSHLV